jgi:hypothetical protein
MESIVALLLLLTESTGDVTDSSTATNQILKCWMFGHWTDVWRHGPFADCGRWRLSSFELLNGGDLFIGRKSDILNLRGVIGEVKEDGRHTQVLCRFEEGYEEWRFPKDLWKEGIEPEDGSEEGSSSDQSSDSLSEEGSQDPDTSSVGESSGESEDEDEEDGGKCTY